MSAGPLISLSLYAITLAVMQMRFRDLLLQTEEFTDSSSCCALKSIARFMPRPSFHDCSQAMTEHGQDTQADPFLEDAGFL